MKKSIFYSILTIVMLITFNGCYTILWTPEEEYKPQSEVTVFYDNSYYGGYSSYYDNLWWRDALVTTSGTNWTKYRNDSKDNQRDKQGNDLRNNDGRGNNSGDRRNPTVSQDGNHGTTTGENNSGNNSNGNNVNTNSNNNTNSSNSNDKKENLRNNDGSRSNSDRRR